MESNKKRVLIVDDSRLVVKKLTEILSESQCVIEVLYAYDLDEAIIILQQKKFDIISLDINLSDASGIDLLKIIKKDYLGTIVAMLTNQASHYYKNLCTKLGADYFLDKSRDFDHFFNIVSSAGQLAQQATL